MSVHICPCVCLRVGAPFSAQPRYFLAAGALVCVSLCVGGGGRVILIPAASFEGLVIVTEIILIRALFQ